MLRLFVAIRPPAAVRDQLLDLMDGLPTARWQDDDQLHLTLRFIGEVDERAADDVHLSLADLRFPRFDLALAGLGTFARKGRVDTLWAGVAPKGTVTALHHKVDAALVRAGLPPERRAFQPHLTLARFSRTAQPDLAPLLARHAALTSKSFIVENFGLYRSELTRDGAHYTLLDRFPLG